MAMFYVATSFLAEAGNFFEGIRPWVSTGALVGLFALCVKLFLDNKKMELDTDGGIRDHYAKEVASLRAQILASQTLSDARVANAEKRYTEAVELADRRHASCEKECDRLREKVLGLERQITQFHKTSLKFFELRGDLPEELREQLRAMEQAAVGAEVPLPRRKGDLADDPRSRTSNPPVRRDPCHQGRRSDAGRCRRGEPRARW